MPATVDASGNLVPLTEDVPPPALAADTPAPEPTAGTGPLVVWTPDGQLGHVDQADIETVLRAPGYRLAAPDEIQRYQDEQTYGDQNARTFVEGASRGLSFGLSDYAFEALGVPKEDIAKRAAINDTSATLGEITGIVAPALLSGGSSLLAKGGVGTAAKIATATPAGLVARLGATGAALVEGERATTALARVAQAAKAASVAGTIEGGLYGAAKQVNDDWLVDHEITAERAAMGGLYGALAGGGGGALLGGGTVALGELSSAAYTALGKMLGRAKVDDAAKALAVGADASATASGTANAGARVRISIDDALDAGASAEAAVESSAVPYVDEASEARKIILGARASEGELDDSIQRFTRLLTDEGSTVASNYQAMQSEAGIARKHALAEQVTWGAPISDIEAVAPVSVARDSLKAAISEAGANATGQSVTAIKRADAILEQTEKRMSEALAKGEIGRAFNALDDGKRGVQRLTSQSKDAFMKDALKNISEQLRAHGEDASLWGELATNVQAPINKSWSTAIRASDSDFLRGAFKRIGEASGVDPWEGAQALDGRWVKGVLQGIGDEGSEQVVTEAQRMFRSRAVDMKTRARILGDESMQAMAEHAARFADTFDDAVNQVRRLKDAQEVFKKRAQLVEYLPLGLDKMAKGLASAYGRMSRNMVVEVDTSALSRAVSKATSETTAEAAAQAAHKAAVKGETSVQDAAEGLLARVGRSMARVSPTARTVRDAVSVLGVRLTLTDPKSYERAISRVQAMRDPESDERAEARGRAASLAIGSQEMADAFDAQMQRQADFLARKAGLSDRVPQGGAFDHLRPLTHSSHKAAKLARYARAVDDPQGALDRLKKGEVVQEDVEALREVYPRLYGSFAQRLIADASTLTKRPSLEARRALDAVLVSQPAQDLRLGQMQALAKSGIGANAQAADNAMGAPAVTPGNARPPELSEGMTTRNDQLMNGR